MAKRSARSKSALDRRVTHNWPPTIVVDSTTVFSIAILPNHNQVITGSDNKILALWDLNKGILVRQMKGHTAHILAVAVTPDEKFAISAAFDDTMRVWDIASGRELLRFEFPAAIKSIAVLPNGRTVLVGSNDHLLRLCDIISGQIIRSLAGHTENVQAVALLPDGHRAISGASDSTMRLWDLRSATEIKRFAHPGDTVWSVAVHPDGRRAVSLAGGIARLWDLNSGEVLNEFQAGHHHAVAIKNQHLLLTGGSGSAIFLWDLESGVQLRRFEGHVDGVRDLAVLSDGRRMLSASDDGSIRLWEIEPSAHLGDDVGYTTARIALLGDSGVGKTGLGWRIAYGEFRPQSSTHGQQFWVIDRLSGKRDDGTRCEVVLWDLAGQPDYRLIHALFLDQVDLGLLVFDATSRERPFGGVEYWLRNLRAATAITGNSYKSATAPHVDSAPTLLVAARVDRGVPAIAQSDLRDFCERENIRGCFVTSALSDIGITELMEGIKFNIPWDKLPPTTTTSTFKRMKDQVLKLKEHRGSARSLLTGTALRRRLQSDVPTWEFTDAEMLAAVRHLETHGYVTQLQRSNGDPVILLDPNWLVNLASSIVLEARRHERGLGLLDEERLIGDNYNFPELKDFSAQDRSSLLDEAVRLFLQRNLCFRENINERSCLVFPSLINEKRPSTLEADWVDDAVYRVRGVVETVYPALVVQLGYTNLFREDHHWQNQAQYELDHGELCGFRLAVERDGEIELVLSYHNVTGDDTRYLFRGIFERFLKRRPVQIKRIPIIQCRNGHHQERTAISKAIDQARQAFYCDICGTRISTPQVDDVTRGFVEPPSIIREAARKTEDRTNYEVAVAWVKAFRRDQRNHLGRPTCFISYAWDEPSHERWVESLADYLQSADVAVVFDRWHNQPGSSISRFVERIEGVDFVCVVGSPLYRQKDNDQTRDAVVRAELRLIKSKLSQRDDVHRTIIPLLRKGAPPTAFPPLMQDSVFIDFRDDKKFFVKLFELILTLHNIPLANVIARAHHDAIGRGMVVSGKADSEDNE